MEDFNQRFIDLSISNHVPNRFVGLNSLNQLDSVLNKFSASLKTIELTLDSLEVNKFTENITAEQIWLDKFELLQSDVDLQKEFHVLINDKCNSILSSLDNEEDALHFTCKIDDLNYRWNTIRLRIIALRNYLENSDEHSKQLLHSVRELIDWISKRKIELNNPSILANDAVTATKQKNDHHILMNKLEDKRPIIESILLTGRQFLAHEANNLPVDTDISDLDLIDCIRREIKKLTEKWTEICQIAENKERIIEDLFLKLTSLQKQVEDAILRLHSAEINKSKFVPISDITNEKIAAHLAELKTFKERIFPLQNNIEQVNSLANLITQCNVPLSNLILSQLDDLNTRWKLLKSSIDERQKALERSVPNNLTNSKTNSQYTQMLNSATIYPWERLTVTDTKVPYYINHTTQKTQWDHPKMTELLTNLDQFNGIRFAAYRLALKLRVIQKKLGLDLIYIHNLNIVFDQHLLRNEINITVPEMISFFQSIFSTIINNANINVPLCIDLALNWMLNLFDTTTRTGSIKTSLFKIALIVFCKATIDEKYLYMFQLIADSNGLVDDHKLKIFFHSLLKIPTYLGEGLAFGESKIDFSIKSCLERSNKNEIEFRDFLFWVQREPQTLVWLAVFHRIIHSEQAKHLNVKCSSCKITPIIGLRYRCLKCFRTDICQDCFFYGSIIKGHKLTHPIQEYCFTTTSGENVRDITRIICNKFKPKNLFMKRSYYSNFMPMPNTYLNNDYLMMMPNNFDNVLNMDQYNLQQLQMQQQTMNYQNPNQFPINHTNDLNNLKVINQINQPNSLNQLNLPAQNSQLNLPAQNSQLNIANQNNSLAIQNQINQLNLPSQNNQLNLSNQYSLNNNMNLINSNQTLPASNIAQPNIVNPTNYPVVSQSLPRTQLNQSKPFLSNNYTQNQQTGLLKNNLYNNNVNFNNEYLMIDTSNSPAQFLDQMNMNQRDELESFLIQLEKENRFLQAEYEKIRIDKIKLIKQQPNSSWANQMLILIDEEYNNNIIYTQKKDEALIVTNTITSLKDQLEAKIEILEEHNRQLMDQISRLRIIMNNDSNLNSYNFNFDKPTTTTSILKNSNNPINRPNTNKSIHFSNNNMVVDNFDNLR